MLNGDGFLVRKGRENGEGREKKRARDAAAFLGGKKGEGIGEGFRKKEEYYFNHIPIIHPFYL